MLQQMKERLKNEKGLTLIELLAVIVILAIIAAIAIPAIGNIIQNSRDRAILSEASNILSGGKLAHTSGDCDATEGNCTDDTIGEFIEGIDSEATFSVTLGDDGAWSVSYSEFANIENIENPAGAWGATTSLNETDLNNLLDNNQ